MCGRYATTRSSADLSQLFEALDETAGQVKPDYNVAPTDPVPIVRVSGSAGGRVLSVARWGLVPHWASDPRAGARMINARVETVATSRAYAQAFALRRCLVPADGWYEWARTPAGKKAYFMTGEGLAMAGIWSSRRAGDTSLLTFSILTTAAPDRFAAIHDRMPLLLPPDRWEAWLANTVSDELITLPSAEFLSTVEIRPVGSAVGDVRNDSPALIERIDDDLLF